MAGVLALGLPFSVPAGQGQEVPGPVPAAASVVGNPPVVVPAEAVVAEPSVEVMVEQPAREPEPPAPEPPPPPDPCGDALVWVEAAGLALPDGVGYRCPSTQFAHHGAACWNAWPCPGTGFIAVNLELMAGTGTEYLRHVVAHEICHILDFQRRGWTSEAGADACAAAHGA